MWSTDSHITGPLITEDACAHIIIPVWTYNLHEPVHTPRTALPHLCSISLQCSAVQCSAVPRGHWRIVLTIARNGNRTRWVWAAVRMYVAHTRYKSSLEECRIYILDIAQLRGRRTELRKHKLF
jgi:hypothetical protein